MNKRRSTFERLHQIRTQRVLEQQRHGAGDGFVEIVRQGVHHALGMAFDAVRPEGEQREQLLMHRAGGDGEGGEQG